MSEIICLFILLLIVAVFVVFIVGVLALMLAGIGFIFGNAFTLSSMIPIISGVLILAVVGAWRLHR